MKHPWCVGLFSGAQRTWPSCTELQCAATLRKVEGKNMQFFSDFCIRWGFCTWDFETCHSDLFCKAPPKKVIRSHLPLAVLFFQNEGALPTPMAIMQWGRFKFETNHQWKLAWICLTEAAWRLLALLSLITQYMPNNFCELGKIWKNPIRFELSWFFLRASLGVQNGERWR